MIFDHRGRCLNQATRFSPCVLIGGEVARRKGVTLPEWRGRVLRPKPKVWELVLFELECHRACKGADHRNAWCRA